VDRHRGSNGLAVAYTSPACEGERFTVSFDGKMLFGVIDKTFAEAGGVALWTKADSVTRFDAMTITMLP